VLTTAEEPSVQISVRVLWWESSLVKEEEVVLCAPRPRAVGSDLRKKVLSCAGGLVLVFVLAGEP
jgi:hypothetical protein